MLVEMFHWSLREIDGTDIESLMPFVFHFPHWKNHSPGTGTRKLFADEVDWL